MSKFMETLKEYMEVSMELPDDFMPKDINADVATAIFNEDEVMIYDCLVRIKKIRSESRIKIMDMIFGMKNNDSDFWSVHICNDLEEGEITISKAYKEIEKRKIHEKKMEKIGEYSIFVSSVSDLLKKFRESLLLVSQIKKIEKIKKMMNIDGENIDSKILIHPDEAEKIMDEVKKEINSIYEFVRNN